MELGSRGSSTGGEVTCFCYCCVWSSFAAQTVRATLQHVVRRRMGLFRLFGRIWHVWFWLGVLVALEKTLVVLCLVSAREVPILYVLACGR